ncbi:MAG TPA: STAS domain-containing protein [Chroococcidiopsis sp.]
MQISTTEYEISYDSDTQTIVCKGSLRLGGTPQYAPVTDLLTAVVNQEPPTLTLDLRGLEFLNSSGINVLSKFVIKVRQQGKSALTICGSTAIPWQGKSLINLQRLMPSVTLEWS